MAWLLPALGAISTIGSLFIKSKSPSLPKVPEIDISKELAKIDKMYEEAQRGVRTGLLRDLGQARKKIASSLAARGIYRSPVSEVSYGNLERAYAGELAKRLADLRAKQAGTEASIAERLAEAKRRAEWQRNLMKYQQSQSRLKFWSNLLGGIGGTLLAQPFGGSSQNIGSFIPQQTKSLSPNLESLYTPTQYQNLFSTLENIGYNWE